MSERPPRTASRAVPFVLAGATAVSILSTDLFTPSIPDLPDVFGIDITTAQQVVSINLFAYSIAHIAHGPLADAVGRRGLFLVAFACFVAASILCALASSIEGLLAGRFLQGLFSSVPSVVVILIIRELYDERTALRVMAIYGAALGIAPAIGPLIGGYLHVWWGWSASFWAIAGLALVVLGLFALLVPETLPERRPLRLRTALRDYGTLLARPAYVGTMLSQAMLFGAFYAFVTTAPVVFIDLLGLPTERYGLVYVVVIAAFICGNLLAERMSARHPSGRLFRLALWVGGAASLCLALPALAGLESIPVIVAGMVPYAVALGMVLVAGPLVLLDTVRDLPQGPASALLGTAQLGFAALASKLSAQFYDNSALSMLLVMAGFCLCAMLGLLLRLPQSLARPVADESAA